MNTLSGSNGRSQGAVGVRGRGRPDQLFCERASQIVDIWLYICGFQMIENQ